MKTLSTQQIIDNWVIFKMTCENRHIFNQILAITDAKYEAGLPRDPGLAWDVEVKVNGVELDIDAFVKGVEAQLEDLVGRAARKLIEEQCLADDQLEKLAHEARKATQNYVDAIETKARTAWGLEPRRDED